MPSDFTLGEESQLVRRYEEGYDLPDSDPSYLAPSDRTDRVNTIQMLYLLSQ